MLAFFASPASRHIPFRLLGVLLAAAITGAVSCDYSDMELLCEEAVAHVTACCNNIVASEFMCDEPEFSCDYETVRPLSKRESECLLDLDCKELQDRKLCERLELHESPVCP